MASNQSPAIVPADAAQIARAAEILREGALVAFPTETVYGLGADATNDRAVAGIFEAKGRPRFNPLIVHVRDVERAQAPAEFNLAATRLAECFWPGPLTLVLPRKPDCPLSLLVSAGLDTVALRVPAHPVAQQILADCKRPIAAPSANRSGHVSPTTAAHVAGDLGARVQLVLDGGATPHGIESTVIGFDGEHAVLLRPGVIAREDIEAIAGPLIAPQPGQIAAPGQLASHYAPRSSLRLYASDLQRGEALLAFGAHVLDAAVVRNLSPSGDLTEAAANLFSMLRELDTCSATRIAVMPIPEQGLGEAINDRLRRAAAPRGPA
jgi:L-threonylcarbamoyladenylate synthase